MPSPGQPRPCCQLEEAELRGPSTTQGPVTQARTWIAIFNPGIQRNMICRVNNRTRTHYPAVAHLAALSNLTMLNVVCTFYHQNKYEVNCFFVYQHNVLKADETMVRAKDTHSQC